jgi:hypothetical protein
VKVECRPCAWISFMFAPLSPRLARDFVWRCGLAVVRRIALPQRGRWLRRLDSALRDRMIPGDHKPRLMWCKIVSAYSASSTTHRMASVRFIPVFCGDGRHFWRSPTEPPCHKNYDVCMQAEYIQTCESRDACSGRNRTAECASSGPALPRE